MIKKILSTIVTTAVLIQATKVLAFSFPPIGKENLINDLPSDRTFIQIVTQVVDTLLLVVGIVALLAIIWAGLQYITAGGDQTKAENARKWIIYIVIGLFMVSISYLVYQIVIQTTGQVDTGTEEANIIYIP